MNSEFSVCSLPVCVQPATIEKDSHKNTQPKEEEKKTLKKMNMMKKGNSTRMDDGMDGNQTRQRDDDWT